MSVIPVRINSDDRSSDRPQPTNRPFHVSCLHGSFMFMVFPMLWEASRMPNSGQSTMPSRPPEPAVEPQASQPTTQPTDRPIDNRRTNLLTDSFAFSRFRVTLYDIPAFLTFGQAQTILWEAGCVVLHLPINFSIYGRNAFFSCVFHAKSRPTFSP